MKPLLPFRTVRRAWIGTSRTDIADEGKNKDRVEKQTPPPKRLAENVIDVPLPCEETNQANNREATNLSRSEVLAEHHLN